MEFNYQLLMSEMNLRCYEWQLVTRGY